MQLDLIAASTDRVTPLTMSSREIAELVESRHDDVKRSIERIAAKGVFTLPPLAEVSNPGAGPKTIGVYNLDKRSSLIVVAQLCPEFTARLVDRWQELEQQAASGQLGNGPATASAEVVTASSTAMLNAAAAGVVSKREARNVITSVVLAANPGATEILAALLGRQAAAKAASPEPTQIPLALSSAPVPAPAPAPKPVPKAKPAPAPLPIIAIRNAPFGGFSGLNFVLDEAGEYVVGGESALRAAMLAHGLVDQHGSPTSKGRSLTTRKSARGHHWRLGDLFRALGGIR